MLARLRALGWPLAVVVAIAALEYGCAISPLGPSSREDVLARLLPSAVQIHDCVPAHPAGAPRLGEEIWVLAFPGGRNMVLAGGIVSQVRGNEAADRESASHLMVDAPVSYGSSGGGVYEARGGGLIGLVEGYRTARVTSQGSESPWYIDVPM